MIAALLCSIYILYLYRKINAGGSSNVTGVGTTTSGIQAEMAVLNAKIHELESMTLGVQAPGISE